MSTITPLTLDTAEGTTKDTLNTVKAKLGGKLPNIFGVLANAPAALDGYLALSDILNKGKIPAKYREQLAIAIAARNACEYCLSAHTAIGGTAGLDANTLSLAQSGKSSDPKAQAIIDLGLEINKTHGKAGAAATQKARAAGLTDEEIVEIAAHVAINVLTNSINGLAGTEVDFPKVTLSNAA
jgi:uncharacterized peroxidase-related enzyme